MQQNTHNIEDHEFYVYTEKDHYTYPYDWASMQSPVFFSILRAFHESSEWILEGCKIRIIMREPNGSHSPAYPELWVMNRSLPLGVAQLARYPEDTQLLSYAQLQTLSGDINSENHHRLMHSVAMAGTIVSMEKELGYNRHLKSKQTFSYSFDIHQIPLADAFFQKMSAASSKLKSITSEVTQSDPGTNPNHYCTFTWSGRLVQVEELARQSVDFGSELGFVNSAEDLFHHFSTTPYLPYN